jgi:hypothetical protein
LAFFLLHFNFNELYNSNTILIKRQSTITTMSAFRSITMQSATFRAASPAIRRAGAARSFQTGRVFLTVKESREGE